METLDEQTFDMIIIGGGATGAGIALDASSRGYKVLLLEKDDFASGTSSKSSKLVHGGVRYLEKAVKQFDKAQYDLVKEGLNERAIFLNNASHLSSKLRLDTPIFNYFELFYVYSGFILYRLLSGSKALGENSYTNRTLLNLVQPSLKKDDILGAVSFFDGRFLDSRMVIALLQTSLAFNSKVKNYHEVKEFLYKDSKLLGLIVKDRLNNREHLYKSKVIINASGFSVDKLRKLDDINCEDLLTLSSGIHIVIPKKFLPFDEGILIPKTSDGRIIFVLPYLDKCLIGTTDDEIEYKENISASSKEIEYLISHVNEYFDTKINSSDVLSSWSGIRPLIKPSNEQSSQQVVREHQIVKSSSNLISIAGGKWTTYRKMAEQLIDFVVDSNLIEKRKACQTKDLKVVGSKSSLKLTKKIIDSYDIDEKVKDNLLRFYGNRADEILKIAALNNDYSLIHKEYLHLKAEVIYAIKYEFIKRPIDFLSRRISLCFIDKKASLESLETVCELMAEYLSWDKEKYIYEYKVSKKLIEELF